MSFNAIESKKMVELSRCFGNQMRELFQSRHFVTYIVFKDLDKSNRILPVDEIWIDELIYPHIIRIQQKFLNCILGFADL